MIRNGLTEYKIGEITCRHKILPIIRHIVVIITTLAGQSIGAAIPADTLHRLNAVSERNVVTAGHDTPNMYASFSFDHFSCQLRCSSSRDAIETCDDVI